MGYDADIFVLSEKVFLMNVETYKERKWIDPYINLEEYRIKTSKYRDAFAIIRDRELLPEEEISYEEYLEDTKDIPKDPKYKILEQFVSWEQVRGWFSFGETCTKKYPKIYAYYNLLTNRISNGQENNSAVCMGYLWPSEIQIFLEELEKIDSKKLKSEVLKTLSYEELFKDAKKRFDEGLFDNIIREAQDEEIKNNPIELLKIVLKNALKDKLVLCMSITW